MVSKLKSLTISNFRTILGTIVVPLDAQVVLVHGSNGLGKSSILSALELGLAGKVAHLESKSDYVNFLTNFGAKTGEINLAVDLPETGAQALGTVSFSPEQFSASPVLSKKYSDFFSERCFLPQAVLGRLLDIYDEKNKNTGSRLTQFVKELLRLEPLDAIADGLSPAFNVTRIRKVAPAFKQLEALQENYVGQLAQISEKTRVVSDGVILRLASIKELVSKITGDSSHVKDGLHLSVLRAHGNSEADRQALSKLLQNKSEVESLVSRLANLETNSFDLIVAEKERVEAYSATAYAEWANGPGSDIAAAVYEIKQYNSDLPTADSDSTTLVEEALRWCDREVSRCESLLSKNNEAVEKLTSSRGIVERANSRIKELNEHLTAGAKDARTLANALAGIVPHVEDEICPVCARDFSEAGDGPLTAHIAKSIAKLTTEAGRLQAFAAERAAENQRLSIAQRDVVTAERGVLNADAVLALKQRHSIVASVGSKLRSLQNQAAVGRDLRTVWTKNRNELDKSKSAAHATLRLLPEAQSAIERFTGKLAASFPNLNQGFTLAISLISDQIAFIETRLELRRKLMIEIEQQERDLEIVSGLKKQLDRIKKRVESNKKTMQEIGGLRDSAKSVATAASEIRSHIVRDVFSGSLNAVWRDLFVRLAPSEQFVPQFKLPTGDDNKVEAVLETLHRSGKIGGAPGAMLSQGNLNTAALTLFLALHLSVPSHLPWLVLDDPVQSMDDLHVSQFAALLRTLSKGLGKQLVVAVHERALFDYLTLELSPSFPGDRLLTVEISRNFNGETIANPQYFEYELDKAICS